MMMMARRRKTAVCGNGIVEIGEDCDCGLNKVSSFSIEYKSSKIFFVQLRAAYQSKPVVILERVNSTVVPNVYPALVVPVVNCFHQVQHVDQHEHHVTYRKRAMVFQLR